MLTCHPVRAWHTQQPRCWGTKYLGRSCSRQLQGCCADALGKDTCLSEDSSNWFEKKRLFSKVKSLKMSNLPTTSSRISFHSMSPPDSWTMVTAILLWRPCRTTKKDKCKWFLSERCMSDTFAHGVTGVPGAAGRCHGTACLLCGPQQQGCS